MKLTDTHIHLDLNEYADDLPQVLERSEAQGVNRWIVPAISSPMKLTKRSPN